MKKCLIIDSVVAYGNSRRGYLETVGVAIWKQYICPRVAMQQ